MIPNESCVTAPDLSGTLRGVLLLMFRERERRSRCINLVVANDSYRSFCVDNPYYRDISAFQLLRRDDAVELYGRPGMKMWKICFRNVGSSNNLQKITLRSSERV